MGQDEDVDSAVLSVTRHQRLLHGEGGEEDKRKNKGFTPNHDEGGGVHASAGKVKLWPSPSGQNYLSSFYTQGRGGADKEVMTRGVDVTLRELEAGEAYETKGQRADQYYTWPYEKTKVRDDCCIASGGTNNFRNKNAPIVWLPTFRD